jgi:beta-lactam-binding protein with PASTA domain
VLGGLTLPFVIGYIIAVRILFPPPEVVALGVPVPDLVGKTSEEAQQALDIIGLSGLEVTRMPSPTADEGRITAQSPLPGQQVRAGAGIRVAVSSGKPRVSIPDVVGFPVERAASLLTRLGFQLQRVDEPSPSEPGRVVAIDPEPGTEVILPSRVTLTISARLDTLQADTTFPSDTLFIAHAPASAARVRWSGIPYAPIFDETRSVHSTTQRAER